jgi:hypothetical protein
MQIKFGKCSKLKSMIFPKEEKNTNKRSNSDFKSKFDEKFSFLNDLKIT